MIVLKNKNMVVAIFQFKMAEVVKQNVIARQKQLNNRFSLT